MGYNDAEDIKNDDLKYLNLLSLRYPTIDEAATEIINLQAILNLPKGTEHFLTDMHGENEPFDHVLRNASGVIKGEIERIWGNSLSSSDKKSLATLIYYPKRKIELILSREENIEDWYKITLYRLIEICRSFSSKYTRSKVRKAMPKNFTYILDELLNTDIKKADKCEYYKEIINTIISIDRAKEFIIAISNLIQRLAIDRLHIIGDIFDRGPGADKIMDIVLDYHAVDIQWGNHDILWMGAASGSDVCIANALRICARYCNLDTAEDAYGINILPLATFAMEFYKSDGCAQFMPKTCCEGEYDGKELRLIAQMHKAITIIQFKLEYQIIKRHPEFQMDDRLLLDKIDFESHTIELSGKRYPLADKEFPTVDPKDPYALTREESELLEKLRFSFTKSEKLQKHIRFLLSKGGLYLICNSNLLFHGCIPMDDDGNFRKFQFNGGEYSGRKYLDYLDMQVKKGFFNGRNTQERQDGLDLMWYLWCGSHSPLFGKDKMATFETYFIKDRACCRENKDPYYRYREEEAVCRGILSEFGLDPDTSHIINGHVPVETKNGENPIKANGKLISIDGGFSKSYQRVTGIAGYTLISDSYGLMLVSHEPFKSTEAAIEEETDIHSSNEVLERAESRIMVKDTDVGADIQSQIKELRELLSAYKKGLIKEQIKSSSTAS
ncbi:MAG: fructose-1,6-bisphosphatase [Clostridia bacterium]|nr:fructose-1,6-bisphosphatase [Clostridia bacterium]